MIEKVVTGGQTGVDRAALDAALEIGVPHAGWCPMGRRAEDGTISGIYSLRETPTADYSQRTEWNVRDSDGTLILKSGKLGGGTDLTIQVARRLDKCLRVVEMDGDPDIEGTLEWITAYGIRVLNVAGPRESTSPGCYQKAQAFMRALLRAATGKYTEAQDIH